MSRNYLCNFALFLTLPLALHDESRYRLIRVIEALQEGKYCTLQNILVILQFKLYAIF
ncbi:unnamed protein product [Prunus brigantina]